MPRVVHECKNCEAVIVKNITGKENMKQGNKYSAMNNQGFNDKIQILN